MTARNIRIRGVVQGVGFRPFVFRLAQANILSGWVQNGQDGVEIHIEGAESALEAFIATLKAQPPSAARITEIEIEDANPAGLNTFTIRNSRQRSHPTVRISPDLPVCEACLAELFDSANPRYLYPYINCTDCGPRYSVILSLPYDRCNTTMRSWPLDEYCATEYRDPGNRRFHAQPVACPACGPHYYVRIGDETVVGDDSIGKTVELLNAGQVVAVKGLGGYHLACDARNAPAVLALRERKFRKEKPFALMVRSVDVARSVVELSAEAESLMTSVARPIVLARATAALPGVAPNNEDLGIMLPYTPLHHLLFHGGAPEILVMTSANRSSEPIAYQDEEALRDISGIADAFLIGGRPIARRVDDSVARIGAFGPVILRRSRGYAPAAVTSIPINYPLLATGADLKNTITLVVNGQAFVSQHIGDLDDLRSFHAFRTTIEDLISMYEVDPAVLVVAHDSHPQFFSTAYALAMTSLRTHAIQHHRAHIASVLAEREMWERKVLGVSLDGTGYGDDGSIWGGEIFAGSVMEGFERVAHLRAAMLAGGDAAARWPVQAAAGFLHQIEELPDLMAAPFRFSARYQRGLELVRKGVRTFPTTSMGRLFDAAAALLGFTHEATFEGQAAMWVEHMGRQAQAAEPYPFPMTGRDLDFRPLLAALAQDRRRGRDIAECARAFQDGIACGLCEAIAALCDAHGLDTIVLSGGVFQNVLLTEAMKGRLSGKRLEIWMNQSVPPNDGGISLGQAAMAAFAAHRPSEQGAESRSTLKT